MYKAYKITVVSFLFLIFIIGAVTLRFYAVTDRNRRKVSIWWTSKMCRVGANFFNMTIDAAGQENIGNGGCLIVSNHMSYLDILVYSAIRPAVYVSSVEMEKTFFLGFMAKIGGTYFIERRNTKNLMDELKGLSELISEGFDVVLFPEGTSTDGSKILPFRSTFIAGATETGVDVIPACIRYDSINGKPFSKDNCDLVCWYGDMSFAPHFTGFLGTRQSLVKVSWLNALSPAEHDRKYITRKAKELIELSYFGAA